MPDLITRSPTNPEFARVIEMSRLRERDSFDFDISPDDAERAALARLLDVRDLRKLRLDGSLAATDGGAWTLTARLGATVTQTCVVTLEPVTTRINQPLTRRFESGPRHTADTTEIAVSPFDEDDEVEPLGERLDLGLVATEALALALPSYPRRDGARLAQAAFDNSGDDTTVKPFAGLAALRDKLGGPS